MSSGLIGKKVGMTSIFDEAGNNVPVTLIEVQPNVVTQVKREDEQDGYNAVQLACGDRKEKNVSSAMMGHFDAAGIGPKRYVKEFRGFNRDMEEKAALGEEIRVGDLFVEGEQVDVVGVTKGKGFQGVVRRHGFSGVGGQTHGQHNRERAPGSIGASSDPSRVFPGMRMAGRMGGERRKVRNLRVVRILPDSNTLLVKGGVPGAKNGFVEIYKKLDAGQ